jgi:NitT/TauT family transport system substrate-binding protein
MSRITTRLFQTTLFVVSLLLAVPGARAETDTVRIAMPYGLGYLPTYVAVDQHLIEKHAAAAGLGPIAVTLNRFASGPATSDLILSGDADIGMGGFGPAFIMWDKTRGTQKVRGMMPLSSSPIFFVSVDPRIHSLHDLQEGDKIAISAIKVTDQAITLQMAATKEWGFDQRFRLDPFTVSMSNPDGLAAILSGQSEVKNHFTIIPFSVTELESGKAHLVMTSEDYLAHGTSGVVMYASARFHDPNPKLYAATAAAFEEAVQIINRDPHLAAQIYVAREPQKRDLGWIEAMIKDPKLILYETTPRGTREHADFMHAIGTLKNEASSWKDLFWENMWDKDGS